MTHSYALRKAYFEEHLNAVVSTWIKPEYSFVSFKERKEREMIEK